MKIKVCTTAEWPEQAWPAYARAFNETFGKAYPESYFSGKYRHAGKGYSFHALLVDAGAGIAGGCTVIPCRYRRGKEEILIGLAVDVFIRESHRTDPLMLWKMYGKLKERLKMEGIVAVAAVPNATAYPYWKKVVKWRDVGRINYWILPVQGGRITGKKGFAGSALNAATRFYTACVCALSSACALAGAKARDYEYSVCENDPYYASKFGGRTMPGFPEGRQDMSTRSKTREESEPDICWMRKKTAGALSGRS